MSEATFSSSLYPVICIGSRYNNSWVGYPSWTKRTPTHSLIVSDAIHQRVKDNWPLAKFLTANWTYGNEVPTPTLGVGYSINPVWVAGWNDYRYDIVGPGGSNHVSDTIGAFIVGIDINAPPLNVFNSTGLDEGHNRSIAEGFTERMLDEIGGALLTAGAVTANPYTLGVGALAVFGSAVADAIKENPITPDVAMPGTSSNKLGNWVIRLNTETLGVNLTVPAPINGDSPEGQKPLDSTGSTTEKGNIGKWAAAAGAGLLTAGLIAALTVLANKMIQAMLRAGAGTIVPAALTGSALTDKILDALKDAIDAVNDSYRQTGEPKPQQCCDTGIAEAFKKFQPVNIIELADPGVTIHEWY